MTETTGFPEDAGQAPAAPREFTPEELEAAAQQLRAQAATVGVTGPEVGTTDLGVAAVQAGAEAQSVDAAELLAAIRQLQGQVAALEAEKRAGAVPDAVKYARALADHLAVKASSHPHIQADADHTWGQLPGQDGHGGRGVLGQAGQLAADAESAAESGHPGKLGQDVAAVESWVKAHARRFPQLDYSYILDLAGEAAQAIAALAA